ncbi:hypothetical protein HMPREF9997_02544 [Corynebacterium durum F0235]|uniref:Uncharacterized protein n=1 Tax=Corynebacterium durum F0235 TaxID=1035195 RepID=L1M981_9CORY|nr:hypothetical protein HMPREF9997_02544 [Corynebacterium durum F0235]
MAAAWYRVFDHTVNDKAESSHEVDRKIALSFGFIANLSGAFVALVSCMIRLKFLCHRRS